MPEHAEVDDHVHHQIEEGPERGDAAEVEEDRQEACDHDGVDECVVLDRAWHPEMAVRDHLHVRQHRQHPRDGKHAGDQARGSCHQRKRHRQVEAGLPEGWLGRFSQRVVLRRHDAIERQAGADRECDQQVDDDADGDGQDYGPAHVPMRIGHLGAAVGDGREPLEGENGQRDRRHEPTRTKISARRFERNAAGPQTGRPEQRNAAHLENGHDNGQQPDRPVARDVHEIGEDDQPHAEDRHENAVRIAAEGSQGVGSEGASDEAFVDDHRQRHQESCARRDRRRSVGFLQDHPDAARRRVCVRHLDIGVGAEGGHDGADHEREREERPGEFGDLAGQREDARADHHAGAHGYRTGKGDAVLLVLASGHGFPFSGFCRMATQSSGRPVKRPRPSTAHVARPRSPLTASPPKWASRKLAGMIPASVAKAKRQACNRLSPAA